MNTRKIKDTAEAVSLLQDFSDLEWLLKHGTYNEIKNRLHLLEGAVEYIKNQKIKGCYELVDIKGFKRDILYSISGEKADKLNNERKDDLKWRRSK